MGRIDKVLEIPAPTVVRVQGFPIVPEFLDIGLFIGQFPVDEKIEVDRQPVAVQTQKGMGQFTGLVQPHLAPRIIDDIAVKVQNDL